MVFKTLFGGPAQSSSRSFVDPSQQPFLDSLRSQGQQALNDSLAQGPFQGRLFAGLTPEQQAAINQGNDFAQGAGASLASTALSSASPLLASGAQFGNNAQRVFDNFVNPDAAFSRAQARSTGPEADALVAAASRDTVRGLTEGALPQLARNASLTGNRGSSRRGVAEGIAARGANDRIADISASVRQGLFDTTLRQDLATSNAALGANAQLGQGFNAGQSALGNSLALAQGNQGLFFNGADRLQQNQQGLLDEEFQRFNLRRNDTFDQLGRFQNIIGPPVVLNESTQTGGSSGLFGNITSGIAGLASAGLFG